MRRAHGFADKLGQGVLQGLKKQDESKTQSFASSHRRNFENGLKVTPKEYEKWDWVIVDVSSRCNGNTTYFKH